jgi:hypothetical protein
MYLGCVMTQETSFRFLTMEDRVQSHTSPSGICGGQSGKETGLLDFLDVPISVSFHQWYVPIHSFITDSI